DVVCVPACSRARNDDLFDGAEYAAFLASIERTTPTLRYQRSLHVDVLGPGTLRTLAHGERDRLAFAQLVERRAGAGGLMEKILSALRSGNETETFFRHACDRSVRRHC